MEVRYVAGDGILVARSGRCVLVAAGAGTPGLVDRLWQDLGTPGRAAALATLGRLAPGRAAAVWDAGAPPDLAHGATAERQGDLLRVTVRPPADRDVPVLRVVEGVVPAAAAEVALPAKRPPAPGTGLIDGIPPEILAGSGPQRRTPPATPPPTVARPARPVGEAPEHTVRVRRAAAPAPLPDGTPDHLHQSTRDPTIDTVLAVRCPEGHLSDALAAACRTCGRPVAAQEPQRVLRPVLGHLLLPDGDRVPLDRSVVLGRRPAPDGPGDWPHLVHLPQDSAYLSRRHLRIDLDGWYVLARDLGSAGGTTLEVPGRDPERIRAHEDHLLEDGTVIDLAGAYRVTYEVDGGATG